ncbi:hypothetical protein [Devriesea agamarum]|uniref:hypothetical protein n=1 Tax=Devriesea agamarum TaxID=472569 RepID=UPI00071D111D|nr:hypothetical protein [Devriesea agamarum]
MDEDAAAGAVVSGLSIEFCGEYVSVHPGCEFVIGRAGDLILDDDNQFLHRRFLVLTYAASLWWIENIGSRLSATLTDATGSLHSWLAPGARTPLVSARTNVVFTAGPTTYELSIHVDPPATTQPPISIPESGEHTVGEVLLTPSQKLLILALAEPLLVKDGAGLSSVPSSRHAARRLGWTQTRFNRKLDNVCDKLDRLGIRGLRGAPGRLASNRRAHLVEYAVFSRLVTSADLPLLNATADIDK